MWEIVIHELSDGNSHAPNERSEAVRLDEFPVEVGEVDFVDPLVVVELPLHLVECLA